MSPSISYLTNPSCRHGPHQTEARLASASTGHIECTVTFTSFATVKHSPGGQVRVEQAPHSQLACHEHDRALTAQHMQADLARSYAAMLQSSCTAAAICSSFPKAIVDVHCLIVESGGSDLAVAMCAASVALADAGIPMYDLVAACAVVSPAMALLLTIHLMAWQQT